MSKKGKVLVEGEVVNKSKRSLTVLNDEGDESEIKKLIIGEIIVIGETEEEEAEEEEMDIDDVKKGMIVIIMVDGEEVEGEVEKVMNSSITVDGEKYLKSDIESVTLQTGEEEETEEEETEEEETEEEETEEEETIDIDDVKKGMTVTIDHKSDGEVSGKVTQVAQRGGEITAIFLDGERVGVSKIKAIYSGDAMEESEEEEEEAEEEEPVSNKNRRPVKKEAAKKKGGGVVATLKKMICKYPTLSVEKIKVKVEKEIGEDLNPSTLKMTFNDVHFIIDSLKEAGKLK